MANQKLHDTLRLQETKYQVALDYVVTFIERNDGLYEEARILRDAIEVAKATRRIVERLSVAQVHEAFGAPGDWGYDTPIGAALSDTYRGKGD